MRALEYPFDGDELLRKKKSLRKELLSSNRQFIDKRIAILGGSTTSDIRLMLELFLLNQGIRPAFYESEYNRYYEDAVFTSSALENFAPDVVYIHTTHRNITRYPDISQGEEEAEHLLQREYGRFLSIWEGLSGKFSCAVVQNNFDFPDYRLLGNMDAVDTRGRISFLTRLNLMFYDYARTHAGFYINDINYLSAVVGLDRWNDPLYWHMYKYSPAVPATPALSFSVAGIIKSIFGKNKKALALDLDNTLWGGIVGDDGPERLVIGADTPMGQVYGEFQGYLSQLKKLGVLLTVNSKNSMENALAGLNHPDGVLKPEDFVAIKANWEQKDINLSALARELNLLPESLVFADDNPAERALIRAQMPGCAVPELLRPELYIRALDRSGFFEVTALSEEDAKRTVLYKENAAREAQRAAYDCYGDYLLSLGMKATIRPFEPLYFARLAQLINKSNQFNLTTRRYTLPEVEAAAADPACITLYIRLSDKFGDSGVVSAVIGRIDGGLLHLDLWIMSCRVLKRGVEDAMLDALVAVCREKEVNELRGYYYPAAKNGMVRDFYGTLGFTLISEDASGGTAWRFQLGETYVNKNKAIEVER